VHASAPRTNAAFVFVSHVKTTALSATRAFLFLSIPATQTLDHEKAQTCRFRTLIWRGGVSGDELLALKRISVRREQTTASVSFLAPEQPGASALQLRVVSDCYLGLDAFVSLPVSLLDPAKIDPGKS
jgi:hypothetical protein